jgi:hypothetical protein
MVQIVDWNQKNENYNNFVNMNPMTFEDLVLTFKNWSKNCGCFNWLPIKEIKRGLFEAFLEIRSIKNNKKNVPFGCGWVQTSQNWCQNNNFFAILVAFIYMVPL